MLTVLRASRISRGDNAGEVKADPGLVDEKERREGEADQHRDQPGPKRRAARAAMERPPRRRGGPLRRGAEALAAPGPRSIATRSADDREHHQRDLAPHRRGSTG